MSQQSDELRALLIEARDWIDSMGDFVARPMDLLARIDDALGKTGKEPKRCCRSEETDEGPAYRCADCPDRAAPLTGRETS